MTPPEGARPARSYRPGEWFGVFGESVAVVLPPSEKSRAARIWSLVDDGAGFDEVLDALIADGLRELPGFVLVSETEGETKVVVRGAAHAEFVTDDETVTVEGSSATTWAERSLSGVRAMRIEVADAVAEADLEIRDGLVRIARTDRPPQSPQQPGVSGEPEPLAEPEMPGDDTSYLPMQDDVGNWSVRDVARSQPDLPGQLRPPVVPPARVARLTISSGEVVEVDRVVVVGRAPEARRFTSDEPPTLVTVPSPNQEISSTHLEIRPGTGADHGCAVVTDLASTNGTAVQQPGLPPEDLPPGVAVRLLPGAVLDLGDGVTITVSRDG